MIIDLLLAYAYWLLTAATLFWTGSLLYRTTRNTLSAYAPEAVPDEVRAALPPIALIPARPTRKPRIPLTAATA